MSDSIYNNAGMPSGQGAAPQSNLMVRCHDCGGTQIWKRTSASEIEVYHDCLSGKHSRECFAALTLERDTLKAELESVKHGSGWWEVTPAGQKKRCSVNEEEELRIACEEVAALKAKVERLSAPVSEQEFKKFARDVSVENAKGHLELEQMMWRGDVMALIAARASAPPTPLVFTCPFDGEIWRFHTQEQLDRLEKHLEWHATNINSKEYPA